MGEPSKILLDEAELPRRWYNIMADLPSPPPPVLHPGTLQPIGPDDLAPLFPMDLIRQEVTTERYVDIPEPASGAPPWPSPAPSTAWTVRCGRYAPRTTRSRTARS